MEMTLDVKWLRSMNIYIADQVVYQSNQNERRGKDPRPVRTCFALTKFRVVAVQLYQLATAVCENVSIIKKK